VIVYSNSSLSLWQHAGSGQYKQLETAPSPAKEEPYILLKTLSHISVWLSITLQSMAAQKLWLAKTNPELNKIHTSLNTLKNLGNQQLKPHLPVMDYTLSVIQQAKTCQQATEIVQLQQDYLQQSKACNEHYSRLATRIQLQGLHKIVETWRTQRMLNLHRSRVMIVGPHGPRDQLIEKQYFHDMYVRAGIADGEHNNGHLVYVEMLPEQLQDIDIASLITSFLGRHQINKLIGKELLNDEQAMFNDVLGKYAPPVIKELAEKKQGGCPFKR